MTDYVRPAMPHSLFQDEDGAVIEYGDRWEDMPPSEAYSRVSHPERFEPLHAVAEALIEHLALAYDVDVSDEPEHAAELMRAQEDAVRAVRLTPANPEAAPLTFVFTAFPGLILHAGLLHDFPVPNLRLRRLRRIARLYG